MAQSKPQGCQINEPKGHDLRMRVPVEVKLSTSGNSEICDPSRALKHKI